jgi:hypothetical protein
MVGHDNITGNPMILFLQIVKPAIYQVITICLLYQRLPFITGKSNKEQTLVIRYISAYRHSVKVLNRNIRYTTPNVPWPAHIVQYGDMGENGSEGDSGQEKVIKNRPS